MASPFAVLRDYQKGLLAVFGILIMLVFVLGTAQFDEILKRWSSGFGGDTVATWRGGSLTAQELEYKWQVHVTTLNFLRQILQNTMQQNGRPRVQLPRMELQVSFEDPGIVAARSRDDLVRKEVMAAKAEELGVVIDDEAVLEFLDNLSDKLMNHADYDRALFTMLNSNRGRNQMPMTKEQIFDHLRHELAAGNLERLASYGMGAETPVVAWTNFNRLNRRVQLEALPLPVKDYLDKVTQKPTEKELQELFAKYKDALPNPHSPLPGFKSPKRVSFGYFKIDFNKFLDDELAKVTDEEIQKEYDAGIARGEYRQRELPPNFGDTKPEEKPDGDAKPPAGPADAPADGAAAQEKKPESPASESPEKPEAKPEAKPESPEQPKAPTAEEKSLDAKPDESPKPQEKSSQNNSPNSRTDRAYSVSLSDDEDAPAKSDAPANEKPADERPAEEKKEPAAEKPAEKSAEKPSEPPADKPATDKPAEGTAPAGEKSDDKPEPPPPPKFKPLSEVRNEVARRVASPRAQQAKKKVVSEVKRAVEKYAENRQIWLKFKDGAEPVMDFEGLALRYGIKFEATPLMDAFETLNHDLGRDVTGLVEMAYFGDMQPLRPQTPEFERDTSYIWWIVDKEKERTLDYREARESVFSAWQREEAFKLATKDAEAKAGSVSGSETLTAKFGADVFETNEFTWFTTGNIAAGMGGPRMSSVSGIESAGEKFMTAVFALKEGESGVALNEPQSIVYVVRVAKDFVPESERREKFLEQGNTLPPRMLWFYERQRVLDNWRHDVEKDMKLVLRNKADGSDRFESEE